MEENRNQPILKKLYELIHTNEDSVEGFKDAADHLKEGELSTIFYRLSQQRALFREELKTCVRELGGDDSPNANLTHSFQKLWMNFKSGLNGSDTQKIIEDCKKAENGAIENYEKTLKSDLPHNIQEILSNQHKLIKGARMQLEEFKKNPQG
jgi:uncharacterized protein (TIGR02284 family)